MSLPRSVRSYAGYVLAAAGLVWVLHDVNPGSLAAQARGLEWAWIWPALAFDVLSYAAQGWRWRVLLEPLGRISVFETTRAIYAGLFTNEVLPMRMGEVVRAWVVARRLGVGLPATAPSVVVERLLDAAWLAVAIGITAMAVPLPRELTRAADVLGAVVLVLAAAFVYLALRKSGPQQRGGGGRIARLLAAMRSGLQAIGFSRKLWLAAAASVAVLLAQILAFWLVMRAGGLHLPFWAGAAVLLIIHLGTAIPNAPANVGSYQFFCVLGLTLFGVPKPQAAALSFIVFIVLTVPLWLLGSLALSTSGLTLAKARKIEKSALSERHGHAHRRDAEDAEITQRGNHGNHWFFSALPLRSRRLRGE